MAITQVFLDPSAPWIITGPVEFDTDAGAHLKLPQGTSYPSSPETGDFFWRSDERKLYRYNGATWEEQLVSVGPHASTHKAGGGDSIKLDELALPGDVTTLDATVDRHGLLPKLGGGTTDYLRADGTWATPSGGGGGPNRVCDDFRFEGAMSTANFYLRGSLPSVSWSGWPSCWPKVISCATSRIVRVYVALVAGTFDWRGTPGSLFKGLEAYSLNYNNAVSRVTLKLELTGSFTGTSFTGGLVRDVSGGLLTVESGTNEFEPGNRIGFRFGSISSEPGRLSNITSPLIGVVWEEI